MRETATDDLRLPDPLEYELQFELDDLDLALDSLDLDRSHDTVVAPACRPTASVPPPAKPTR